jgi:plastocyanin
MSRRRWPALTLLTLAGAAIIPTAALGGAHASSGHSVVLKQVRFNPGAITINRGDSVTFVWRDGGEKHNVTFRGFHSKTMGKGSYSVRFMGKGTFNYRCTIHESKGMRGKIVVH